MKGEQEIRGNDVEDAQDERKKQCVPHAHFAGTERHNRGTARGHVVPKALLQKRLDAALVLVVVRDDDAVLAPLAGQHR